MPGDPGIDNGVVGYSYPASEQFAEWSYECESGGVYQHRSATWFSAGVSAHMTHMRVRVVVGIMAVDVHPGNEAVVHIW